MAAGRSAARANGSRLVTGVGSGIGDGDYPGEQVDEPCGDVDVKCGFRRHGSSGDAHDAMDHVGLLRRFVEAGNQCEDLTLVTAKSRVGMSADTTL